MNIFLGSLMRSPCRTENMDLSEHTRNLSLNVPPLRTLQPQPVNLLRQPSLQPRPTTAFNPLSVAGVTTRTTTTTNVDTIRDAIITQNTRTRLELELNRLLNLYFLTLQITPWLERPVLPPQSSTLTITSILHTMLQVLSEILAWLDSTNGQPSTATIASLEQRLLLSLQMAQGSCNMSALRSARSSMKVDGPPGPNGENWKEMLSQKCLSLVQKMVAMISAPSV